MIQPNALVEPSRNGGLYVIWLSDTHYYGGRAKNFQARGDDHLRCLRQGYPENSRVQAVFNKYGRFEPTVLVSLGSAASPEDLRDTEQKSGSTTGLEIPECSRTRYWSGGGSAVSDSPQ